MARKQVHLWPKVKTGLSRQPPLWQLPRIQSRRPVKHWRVASQLKSLPETAAFPSSLRQRNPTRQRLKSAPQKTSQGTKRFHGLWQPMKIQKQSRSKTSTSKSLIWQNNNQLAREDTVNSIYRRKSLLRFFHRFKKRSARKRKQWLRPRALTPRSSRMICHLSKINSS